MAIRLLYIEDDLATHRFMREFANREGYELHDALTGESALQMARELLPDVIVTDINLPDINGEQICETLKADSATAHIPIIAFTGHSNMHGDRERLLAQGFDGYIDKPFNSFMLKVTIERLTKQNQG